MAVIGKIQKNSLLLLIVIGLAMLAFIFTDFLKGGGNDAEQLATATLNDEPIDQELYDELREAYVNRSKNELAYQGKEFTDNDDRIATDNAFNEVVRRTILNSEFEKLGIVCTTDELNDMIHGNHIHPWVIQIPIFNGPNGFSKDSVRSFISRLEVEPEGATDEVMQGWLESRQQWKDFEQELKNARMADKYVALIKKGVYVNKLEAADQYDALYHKKQISYVVQRYADIPEDEVTITDDEIKAYFEEHKDDPQYEQVEARDIQMIFLPIQPTQGDLEIISGQLEDLKTNFSATTNNMGFVFQNSDNSFLSDSTVFRMGANDQMAFNASGGSYPKSADDIIQESKPGDVIGPFMSYNSDEQRNELAIAKVVDTPTEKQAWVRHILISTGATRTEARAKTIADSLIRVIKAEDNFAALVPQVSEDPGSIDNGGEYKWFAEGVMVPEFNDASFNGEIGKLQLVKTSYGYHIVEVLGQADRITPVLAVVSKAVRPSETTIREVETRAFEFIYEVSEMEGDSAFNKMAMDSSMDVQSTRVNLTDNNVLGLVKGERLLRFAFNSGTKEGDLSDPILDGDKYVVAIVDNVIEEGAPEFADVKQAMKIPALKEKQAEVYSAKMAGKGSLEAVATALPNGIKRSGEITFSSKSVNNGVQAEPYIIGKLFTQINEGQVTKPIVGEDGIYVFQIENDLPAEETTDLTTTAVPMRIKRVGGSDTRVIKALREKADLVDNRKRIEYR